MDLRTAPPAYLAEDDVVDLQHPAVQALHEQLAAGDPDDVAYVQRAFEHVRDRVAHSYDVADPRVTARPGGQVGSVGPDEDLRG